jgi:hypothetical protein
MEGAEQYVVGKKMKKGRRMEGRRKKRRELSPLGTSCQVGF